MNSPVVTPSASFSHSQAREATQAKWILGLSAGFWMLLTAIATRETFMTTPDKQELMGAGAGTFLFAASAFGLAASAECRKYKAALEGRRS